MGKDKGGGGRIIIIIIIIMVMMMMVVVEDGKGREGKGRGQFTSLEYCLHMDNVIIDYVFRVLLFLLYPSLPFVSLPSPSRVR